MAHPGVDKVAFTGSTEVGKLLVKASAGNLKKLTLELGGKSPHIILADADVKRAARSAASAVYYNQGQMCTAGSRIYVERAVYDRAVEHGVHMTHLIDELAPTDDDDAAT